MNPPTPALDEARVRDALRSVQDPEIGMNIVDLGLVYAIAFEGPRIVVRMTMTSPACPMGQMIVDDVTSVLEGLSPDADPVIELVWSPEWSPAMMSAAAKTHFGWQDDDA